jgi:flagellar biosynthetic protein FliR
MLTTQLAPFGPHLTPLLLEAAMSWFMVFVLVLVRLSGLMMIGPFFGHTAIPLRIRVLLAFSLALLVTPALWQAQERGFQQLDVNHDGQLSAAETPRMVLERKQEVMQQRDLPGEPTIRLSEFRRAQRIPSTLFDLLWVSATELMIGLLLGFGVLIVLSGLQLAGETFDQQAGTAMSEIFNPAMGTNSSPTGQLFVLMGTTALLVMLPFDGHLMMLTSLLKTFEVIPLGLAWIDVSTLDLMRHLMSQSLVIAIQIAAPLLAAMALLSVAMGFLGYTVPQINVLVLGFPIRAMLSLSILLVTLSGASEAIVDLFPTMLDQITESLITAGR